MPYDQPPKTRLLSTLSPMLSSGLVFSAYAGFQFFPIAFDGCFPVLFFAQGLKETQARLAPPLWLGTRSELGIQMSPGSELVPSEVR